MNASAQDNSPGSGRPASRRAMLARTATGVVVAAGAATALGGLNARPASAATGVDGVTDRLNVTDPQFGADPTGLTDSSGAINNAILAAAAPVPPAKGCVVYMPTGTYLLANPIIIQNSVTLIGDQGAMQSGDDASQRRGTVLQVASTFRPGSAPASAAIVCSATAGVRLRDFWIYGGAGAPGVGGIALYGAVRAWAAVHVGVDKASGDGFTFIQVPNGGSFPDGIELTSCLAQQCAGDGFTGKMVDAILTGLHAQGNGGDGISLTGGNCRFMGCRSDLNGNNGWNLDHAGNGDGYDDAIILDGCGGQRNNHNGVLITNSSGSSWHDPVLITGCSFAEDGQDGTWSSGSISGGDGLNWAGIHVEGNNHVHISNTLIAVGTVDVAAGCPQYGIRTATVNGAKPAAITVSGGRVEARSPGTGSPDGLLVNDTVGVGQNLRITPDALGALGYQTDTAVYPRQGTVTLSGGTAIVTSPWISPTTLIVVSPLKASSAGFLSVSPGTGSFTITSSKTTDSSTVAWMLTTA